MTRSDLIYNMENNLKPSGCTEYHHALTFLDWKNLAKQLNSNLHGHIHELVGGSWNSDETIRRPATDAGNYRQAAAIRDTDCGIVYNMYIPAFFVVHSDMCSRPLSL
jgi:hypothetical protein